MCKAMEEMRTEVAARAAAEAAARARAEAAKLAAEAAAENEKTLRQIGVPEDIIQLMISRTMKPYIA